MESLFPELARQVRAGVLHRSAYIVGEYRYSLARVWDGSLPRLTVIGLNPSTADATTDDPTIRRLYSFADREGCGSFMIVNLFGLRSTDPKALKRHPLPIGTGNDLQIGLACDWADLILCAWGAVEYPERVQAVRRILEHRALPLVAPVKCLGRTKDRHPRHPLYVRGDAPLIDFTFETRS